MEVSGQLHAPVAVIPGQEPCTHWIGGKKSPIAGLDAVEKGKILHCRESNPAVQPVARRTLVGNNNNNIEKSPVILKRREKEKYIFRVSRHSLCVNMWEPGRLVEGAASSHV
jgi:hypothetical protein